MKKRMVIAALMLMVAVVFAVCKKDPNNGGGAVTVPTGGIDGLFTVNLDGDKVFFSQGNLQYTKSTGKWSFMEHQYDLVETLGQEVGEDYANQDVVSLFCWATSGYDHGAVYYQPWSTTMSSNYYYAYGNSSYTLYDQTGEADWGYNAISNGGNTINTWRTLTMEEWECILFNRSTSSQMRFAKACVNDVNGLILLPDNWSSSYFALNSPDSEEANFSSNTITDSQWLSLEQHGAVFLPAAGYRNLIMACGVGGSGNYWSASCGDYGLKYGLHFCDQESDVALNDYYSCYGFSVRLVCPAQ